MTPDQEKVLRDALKECQESGNSSLTISSTRLGEVIMQCDEMSGHVKECDDIINSQTEQLEELTEALEKANAAKILAEELAQSERDRTSDLESQIDDLNQVIMETRTGLSEATEAVADLSQKLDQERKDGDMKAHELQAEKEGRAQLMTDYNALKTEHEEALKQLNVTITERDAAIEDGAKKDRDITLLQAEKETLRQFIDDSSVSPENPPPENKDADNSDTEKSDNETQ